ncbi:MAG: P-loop NTPase [Archangiaceae bacterium]|nr:P-loop NTPase [Archangiaceae bacterium]
MSQGGEAENKIIEFPRPKPPRAPRKPRVVKTTRARRIVAVGGGKGGIGKSLVSANLGIALAQRGSSVVLVDADLGGANLHSCLGVPQPQVSLSDFIDRRAETLEEVAVPTGIERLKLISGARDVLDAANPRHAEKQKLLRHIRSLDVDYVIVDLGAGTGFNTLDFFLLADTGIVVLLPEPTSIENAYRFIKAAFFRRLQLMERTLGCGELIADALAGAPGAAKTPFELLTQAREKLPEAYARLEVAVNGFRPQLVLNQARTRADHELGSQVSGAWKKFFGLDLGYLGAVAHDDAAWKAVRAIKPLLIAEPGSTAAAGLLHVAENLLSLPA